MSGRREFLKKLGIGAGAAATAPLTKLLDSPPTAETIEALDPTTRAALMDHLELAWGIIANASDWADMGGKGLTARREWQAAAERWRDEYHAILDGNLPAMDDTVEEPPKSRCQSEGSFPHPDCTCLPCMDARCMDTAVCEDCGGTGEVDSGGFTQYDEPINVPCSTCSSPAAFSDGVVQVTDTTSVASLGAYVVFSSRQRRANCGPFEARHPGAEGNQLSVGVYSDGSCFIWESLGNCVGDLLGTYPSIVDMARKSGYVRVRDPENCYVTAGTYNLAGGVS